MNDKEWEYIQSLTDQEVVKGILDRDARITRLYLYEHCYPLFKALYNRYETDCESCVEFINDIYLYLMTPTSSGLCYLERFKFGCRFIWWLKISATNYCRQVYRKKSGGENSEEMELDDETLAANDYRQLFSQKVRVVNIDDVYGYDDEKNVDMMDRLPIDYDTIDEEGINKEDAIAILHLMKNPTYRKLIHYRYIKELSNQETAEKLGMIMDNYYNAHKRAKGQCIEVLKKEGLL